MTKKKNYDAPELELEMFTIYTAITTSGQDGGDDEATLDSDGTPFQEYDIFDNGIPNY